MTFLKSAFSLFIGVASLPGIWAAFPNEVETQFANIDRGFRSILEQANVKILGLPFSGMIPEEQNQFIKAVLNEVDDSMSCIRTLITEDDPQFPSVLTRLSDVLNRNLWHATSNIEDKEEALREARANLEFLEERMESLENTSVLYGTYFHKRCAVIDFMSSLGGANSAWNERSEALEMLNRDVDLTLNNSFFRLTSAFINGEKISVTSENVLFTVNYLWKIKRVGTQPAAGHFDPSLPSWSAFYSLEGPQRPPTRLENIGDADNRMTSQRRYPDSGDLRSVYEKGMSYETIFRGLMRECSRGENSTCVICLEDIEEEEAKMVPCFHSFHRDCIRQWVLNDSNCPVCRHPISCMLVV